MTTMNDTRTLLNYLRDDQYKDSSNLDARADLHRRFSIGGVDLHEWVFNHLNILQTLPKDQTQFDVLECGCGPGWLWQTPANLNRIPAHCTITLTDLSPGMVAEARSALESHPVDFRFQEANIEELPFDDDIFDVVTANHMLYHVPNREQALQEIHRILKPSGKLYATTNGATHLQELHHLIGQVASSRDFFSAPFQLENGAQQLAEYFADVTCHRYDNALRITELEPLVIYILSTQDAEIEAKIDELTHLIEQQLKTQGAIYVTKSTGLFEAQK